MGLPTVHEVLVRARRLIVALGWVQGETVKVKNRTVVGVCSIGAVNAAIAGLPKFGYDEWGDSITEWPEALREDDAKKQLYRDARAELDNALIDMGVGQTVIAYNDATWRTVDEVVAMFDRAIAATAD